MNFKTAFEVQQFIRENFPGVNTATEVPTRLRWVKKGKKVIKEFVPLSQKEQKELAPFVSEFRRLYHQPVEVVFSDDEICGDRMI